MNKEKLKAQIAEGFAVPEFTTQVASKQDRFDFMLKFNIAYMLRKCGIPRSRKLINFIANLYYLAIFGATILACVGLFVIAVDLMLPASWIPAWWPEVWTRPQ